jgi:hypothetical protein
MQLGLRSDEALTRWLNAGTWHTNSDFDLNRWFDFVNEYNREHGYVIDEPALREEIEHRVTRRGGTVGEELRNIIRDQIDLAYSILDFLKHTGR